MTTLRNTHYILCRKSKVSVQYRVLKKEAGSTLISKANPLLIMTSGLTMMIREKDRCNETFSKWSMSVIHFDIFIAQPAYPESEIKFPS